MTSISSLGVGSGLDLSGLVDSLLEAERAPVENALNRRQSQMISDLSGVGLMKSSLSTFRSGLYELSDASNFDTRSVSNTNSSALSVSADNESEAGSYSIGIDALAVSQSMASNAYDELDDTVGTGTIQIRFGTITAPGFTSFEVNSEKDTQTIEIDSSNNTLTGLKDYINDGDYGVSAAIINDGSGYRLTLTSDDTGETNAMEITITDTGDLDDTDTSGLSALAYNDSATNMTETQTAASASITVNGLSISSESNSLDEVIGGVTLELLETTDSSLTLTISESSSDTESAIRSLVESYNEMILNLKDLGSAGSTTTQAGLLFGDVSLRTFTNSLYSIMTSTVDGLDGNINALANIGITTQADSTLAIDESDFSDALDEDPVDVLAIFATVGQTTDSLIEFDSSGDYSEAGVYAIYIDTVPTQGVLNGNSGVSNLIIDDDNDELTISIDGVSTGNISLTQGTYASATDLAVEIQSQINNSTTLEQGGQSVVVSYDSTNDRFDFTSASYGSDSTVEISAVDTNSSADLGLTVATGTDGVDVEGSINGVTATGEGQTLTTADDLVINVLGGVTGSRGELSFTRGIIEELDDLFDGYLDSISGALSAREDGLNESLEEIEDKHVALENRLVAIEARLIKQFTALDILLAEFQSTGNFLTQQINSLPGSGQLLNKK
ncbi:MAG: flagellar filament capping protein FliD [Gammaproteobacteria bacterium]|nr:flagellar filament capping protein FliD [Gammaproteobacteria bacterium]